MKQIVVLLLMFLPRILNAQNDSADVGIHFEHGLSWNQIVAKAEAENKYIFVDCYATWCAPCKQMDNTVYSLEQVGDYFKDHFISVKVQMDSTLKDNDEVKSWYKMSQEISKQYDIISLPSLLFFSSQGMILNKGVGLMSAKYFITLSENAIDTAKQYYTLLYKYRKGELKYSSMPLLARESEMAGDKDISKMIANDYLQNFFFNEKKDKQYTKENIDFMMEFTDKSSDFAFKFLYNHARRVDSIIGHDGFSQGRIDYIIAKEEIDPTLIEANKEGEEPNWDSIVSKITRKYNADYADRTVFNAHGRWSHWKQDWPRYIRYLILSRKLYGSNWDTNALNNNAWDIFQHSANKNDLTKALLWSGDALRKNPGYSNYIDTYANILYKLGRIEDAISWERKAEDMEPANMRHKETFEKMKKGLATWPLDGK